MLEKLITLWKKNGIGLLVVPLFVVFSIICPTFLKVDNLLNILRQSAILGTLVVGVTFVMISGNCDLSVGSIIAVIGVILALLIENLGVPVWLAVIIAILIGVFTNALNGILAVTIKVTPFVITLATMSFWSGVTYVLSNAKVLMIRNDAFRIFGQGMIAGKIPVIVVIFLVMLLIGMFILNKTYFGRYVYAIGGNRDAAHLAGININRMTIYTHMVSGVFVGIAAVLYTSRVMCSQPNAAANYHFDCITAACLGGVSMAGGEGKLSGCALGVIALQILFNGMTLLGVNEFWQKIATGLVLLLAITLDSVQRNLTVKKEGNA